MPPEPLRWAGGSLIRSALVRADRAEDEGRAAGPATRFVAGLPRRLGLRLPRREPVEHRVERDVVLDLLRRARERALGDVRITTATGTEEIGVRPASDWVAAISSISATYRHAFAEARASVAPVRSRSAKPVSARSSRTCSTTPLARAVRSACARSATRPL